MSRLNPSHHGYVAMLRNAMGIVALLTLAFDAVAQPVKIGIYPSNDPAKLDAVMSVFAEYLTEQTGDEVSAVITRDYNELVERLRENSVNLGWINTLNYVRITRDIPAIRYIATYMERKGDTGTILPYYQSYIVAMKPSGFTGLADIKDRIFAFTDVGSTSGYGYPNLLLRNAGINPDTYFAKVFFLKKHDRVIKALRAGSIDVGAVSDGTYFTAVRKHGSQFTVLAKSDPIPLDAIVAAEMFPDDRMAAYRKALVTMPSDHRFCAKMRDILGWSAAGFEVRDDSFYDSARAALRQ